MFTDAGRQASRQYFKEMAVAAKQPLASLDTTGRPTFRENPFVLAEKLVPVNALIKRYSGGQFADTASLTAQMKERADFASMPDSVLSNLAVASVTSLALAELTIQAAMNVPAAKEAVRIFTSEEPATPELEKLFSASVQDYLRSNQARPTWLDEELRGGNFMTFVSRITQLTQASQSQALTEAGFSSPGKAINHAVDILLRTVLSRPDRRDIDTH